jgi:drug/metabolite transporter (DMT)-like permease
VLVAIIMVFLKVVPSWPVWLAIAATFGGVLIMTQGSGGEAINPVGVMLSLGSALVYALFIVIINRSKAIAEISNSLLTFYSLTVGALVFLGISPSPIRKSQPVLRVVLRGSILLAWQFCQLSSLLLHSLLQHVILVPPKPPFWAFSSPLQPL